MTVIDNSFVDNAQIIDSQFSENSNVITNPVIENNVLMNDNFVETNHMMPSSFGEVYVVEVEGEGGGEVGTSDHNLLENRDLPNQHPISAITGLEKELSGKQPKGNYLTEHQSLDGYATEKWVEDKKYLTEHQSLEDYAKKKDIPTIPTELPASDVYDWAKQPTKPTYTASEVGADTSGSANKALEDAKTYAKNYTDTAIGNIPTPDVSGQISTHNTNTEAHNDIRLVIQTLTQKVNDLLDSDDTTLDQMSEVVAYIKDNREIIESVTTTKVNVSDIIDNLTTNVSDRPLSAAQGVALKALIDGIVIPTVPTNVSAFNNDAGYLTEHQSLARYVKQSEVDSIVQDAVTVAMKTNLPYTIGFNQGKLYAPATTATYSATNYTDNSVTFNYRGGGGVEEIVFPITGLYTGRQYTIVFDETYNGTFIQDTYRYGCGIMQKSTYDATTFPNTAAAPSYIQWHTGTAGTQSGDITFTANASTVYWVWNLGRLSDGKDVVITFNAKLV